MYGYLSNAYFSEPASPETETDPVARTERTGSEDMDPRGFGAPSPDLEAQLAEGWIDLEPKPSGLTPRDLPRHAVYPTLKSPSWNSEDDSLDSLTGLEGWNDSELSPTALTSSDLHPSQLGRSRLEAGPYEIAADQCSWVLPAPPDAHPLSLLLAQLSRPKFCSSTRWIYSPEESYYSLSDSKLTSINLFSSQDGSVLGTIGSLDLHALQKLSAASPFGMGSQTVYDDAVRRGREITAAQLHVGLAQKFVSDKYTTRDGAWYFSDIAFHVGRYLFPEAHSLKIVLYKLALYTPGGHFRMHKDTTHTDSHVGTLLIGCGVAQDDDPGSEEWEAMDYDHTEPENDGYTGGDLVILNDFGEEQRYHLRPGQVLAFCTDVSHAVDVVTSGVKVTLQFDIYLEDDSVPRDNTVACVDLTEWQEFYRPVRDNDFVDTKGDTDLESSTGSEEVQAVPRTPCASCGHPNCIVVDEECQWLFRCAHEYGYPPKFNEPVDASPRWPLGDAWLGHWRWEETVLGRYPRKTFAENVDRFVRHLVDLLRDPSVKGGPPRTVAFLLSHLYRKRSIQPMYLKSIDQALYTALAATGKLRIILHHVTFELGTDHPPKSRMTLCPPYESGVLPKDIAGPIVVLNRPGSQAKYLRTNSDDSVARGEVYMGNEAIDLPNWYVAGAMFVSLAE